ncbi:hypothetical protein BZG02_00645 [Labilibaculum filiforme]|uniref:Right handed beta helix domain-containing protein n=1 Tax=Labilibaculum filiforme TaxID=1940526 RepID=A0A2N3I5H2_9BACT|nr:choice-of-anchor Q domain-containing protein [Labilibaculum filiforme]PKQ65546.1 hypothetical protein BZG02_00645 [Labilibaculum filiforme]
MHFYRFLFFIAIFISLVSCDKEEQFTTDPNFRLSFSTDTLDFEALFTGFGSTTKQVKVKNTSSNKVIISHLYLQNSESAYRLNVNGIQSNDLMDITLDAKDSLFIFVEVDLQAKNEDAPRMMEDHLVFAVNGNLQGVVLKTVAQDVYVIDTDIQENVIWTANRPYLLTESVWLDKGIDLIVDKGARVYFKKNVALHVKGNLEVTGSFHQPVYFGSSRLDESYKNIPGQWNGIYFYDESTTSYLSHFILENGISGLNFTKSKLDKNPVRIEYGVIRNFTGNGLQASNSNITAHDMLITNCGEECVLLKGEGSYQLVHSTLYNSWFFSARSAPIISYNGNSEDGLIIRNCIVEGNRLNELDAEQAETVLLQHSLLKLGNSAQTTFASSLNECLFNEDPAFINVNEFDFNLSEQSPVINKGSAAYIATCIFDLAGNRRDQDVAPDMGCYEFFETE